MKQTMAFVAAALALAAMLVCGVGCSAAGGAGEQGSSQGAQVAQGAQTDQGATGSQDAQGSSVSQAPAASAPDSGEGTGVAPGTSVDEGGSYTSKDEVALYIHTHGHLPSNFISKTKARKAGWVSREGNLQDVLPGKSIGGSEFYNDDGQLPDAQGRTWKECDINYHGGYRGEERIVFSSDGLVYYTGDHYETFTRIF